MLHLVAFGPAREDRLSQLARSAAEDDGIVLFGDAVWFSQSGYYARLIEAVPATIIHVLDDDLRYAGLENVTADVRKVDYDDLAALTETHETSASWYP